SEELRRRQPIVEAEMFGKKANFPSCLDVTDRAPEDLRLAAGGKYQAQQHFYRRALACAVRAQKTENLTPGNIEREVSDCHFAAEDFAQPTSVYGKVRRLGHL